MEKKNKEMQAQLRSKENDGEEEEIKVTRKTRAKSAQVEEQDVNAEDTAPITPTKKRKVTFAPGS